MLNLFGVTLSLSPLFNPNRSQLDPNKGLLKRKKLSAREGLILDWGLQRWFFMFLNNSNLTQFFTLPSVAFSK